MKFSFVTVLHDVKSAWAVTVAALGMQLQPFGPRTLYVRPPIHAAYLSCIKTTWDVRYFTFTERKHRKDIVWNATDYDRVIFIDADSLILPHFSMSTVNRLVHLPQDFYAVSLGRNFNTAFMVLKPSTFMYEKFRVSTKTHRMSGCDQPLWNYVIKNYNKIEHHLKFVAAMHGIPSNLSRYDVMNVYNSQRKLDAVYTHGPAKTNRHQDMSRMDVDDMFISRRNMLFAKFPSCVGLPLDGNSSQTE
jgi:hypothetical protein